MTPGHEGVERGRAQVLGDDDGTAEFTDLVPLIGSRARLVTAGDEARRRLERNLHDGEVTLQLAGIWFGRLR